MVIPSDSELLNYQTGQGKLSLARAANSMV
jgi:hypothetical protein